ncbi:MAG: DUF4124 domain-containing protein, partial [Pseudomonadota bacterium]|nr:DUF4124 domain-containing protein [Pseudomonadota bacterium]
MRTALYVLLALAAPAFAGQTVYKWVDEKGVTHFSDQPVNGAEKVELSSGPSRSSEPPPAYAPPRQETTTQKGPAYERFVVESPKQDESIVNTGGAVRVSLASTPALGSGHVVALYLDGARVEDFPPTAMSHDFSNVPRGTHTVKAVVSTIQGRVLQETPVTTFHVRQESAAQPPVGPALRNNNNKPRRTSGNKMPTSQPSYAALNGGMPKMDPRTNKPVVSKPAPSGP